MCSSTSSHTYVQRVEYMDDHICSNVILIDRKPCKCVYADSKVFRLVDC